MQTVLAIEYGADQFDNIQMLLALIDNHALNSDRITNGTRVVTGEPMFTQEMAERITKEIKATKNEP